jgi:excisionase family DNA binding protein
MAAEVNAGTTEPPLTTGQVAERYNVNRGTVKRWADNGRLTFFLTPSGQRRFHVADIEAAIAATTKAAS